MKIDRRPRRAEFLSKYPGDSCQSFLHLDTQALAEIRDRDSLSEVAIPIRLCDKGFPESRRAVAHVSVA